MNQKTLITILAILVIILTSSTLYFATTKKTGDQGSKQQPQSDEIKSTTVDDWKNYQNEKYGFSLIFNNLWTNYQVIEKDPAESDDKDATAYLHICVPTQSTKWSDIKPGVYCPLIITVVESGKWEQYQKDNAPLSPTFINKNATFVYSYSTSQNSPDEAGAKIASDYTSIIKSFATIDKKSTSPKVNQNTITDQDMTDLRVVLEKEQPEYVSAVKPTWTIEVGAKNGRYIRATLYKNGEFIPSYPSFYAYKADDGWKIIFSGQETPECSKVNALNFPDDIITECFEGNKTIQR